MMCRMRLSHHLPYDAPAEAVRAMLVDPAFWDRVALATGAISSTTTVEGAGDRVTVVTDEEQPVAGVPSFAKKFVGDSARAIKRQVWSGTSSTFEVDTPGKPTSMSGTATLVESGGRTTLTYDLEVKASVPLVGGKLERLVCELTGAGFDTEHEVGEAWLAGSGA